jgi:glyoxylase-like metal-dependent hydrolase (beta-lactamase superfamily II)
MLLPAAGLPAAEGVEISVTPVAGSVHLLQGEGGNIGVSAGADGVFMIDDQYAPLTDDIRAAIGKISRQPIRFVINTHWHGDHTGGNENLGKAGVVIVAHDNVRKRMSTEQFIQAFGKRVPPSPAAALPVVTFSERVSFHLNDDEIRVQHVRPAHTDGDSIIHFIKADVLHLGDTFFNRMYPFIDLSSGGSIDGMMAAAQLALKLAGPKTKIIPGHGSLTDKAGLQTYADMLADVRARVQAGIDQRQSLAQVQAAKPTAKWDADWGGGFFKADAFVAVVYASLSGKP